LHALDLERPTNGHFRNNDVILFIVHRASVATPRYDFRAMRLATALLLAISSFAAQGNAIKLHVLQGKNGQPIPNQHVVIFQARSPGELERLGSGSPLELQTDAKGVAVLPTDIMPWFSVLVDWHRQCESKHEATIFSVEKIRDAGFVTRNTCGRTTAKLSPNDLYVFVRDETFFEKMRH
jgi:hypothetical protein